MPQNTHQWHNRQSRDPITTLPTAFHEHASTNPADPLAEQTISTTHRPVKISRKTLRKQKRHDKKQKIQTAQQEWKARRLHKFSDTSQTIDSSSKHRRDDHPSRHRSNKFDTATKPTEPSERAEHVRSVQPVKKQEKDEGEAQNDDHDPDTRQTKRLEKLLGIARKRKRTCANPSVNPSVTKPSASASAYGNAFGDGDDDLLDLLQFCDARQNNKAPRHENSSSILSPRVNGEEHADYQNGSDVPLRNGQYSEPDQSVQSGESERSEPSEQSEQSEHSEQSEQANDSEYSDESHERGKSRVSPGIHRADDIQAESTVLPEVTEDSPRANPQTKPPTHQRFSETPIKLQPSRRDSSARNGTKYVPPSARKQNDRSTDMVKRRLRGLLNRVADVNATGIAEDLVQLFRTTDCGLSRRQLASLYANAALDSSRDGSGVGQVNPYVQSHAAIATHLGKHVDGITLATLVVSAVRRTVATLGRLDVAAGCGPDAELDLATREETHNAIFGYIAVLCALYARGGISSRIVYDLVKLVADQLNGVRLELLLFMLRQVGPLLRMDDPAGLKDVIEFIQEHASSNARKMDGIDNLNKSETKVQIMLDLINDIKNNKVRKNTIKEDQVKFAWAAVLDTPLNASINDLLDDDFVEMRWWDDTKGLTIAERKGESRPSEQAQPGDDVKTDAAEKEPDLSTLASCLRLNTDYRRALFRSIMSSASVSDAFDRLENMGAFDVKKGQDRDTALVILHCCASEKDFNPFYAVLAERFCRRSRRHRFVFEFALWDVFKSIPGSAKVPVMPRRKRNNCAHLLAHLWGTSALSLSVLRCVSDFEECGDLEKSFYVETIVRTIHKLQKQVEGRLSLFEKLQNETWNGVDDFRTSLSLFMRRAVISSLPREEVTFASQAVGLLERG